MRRQKTLFDSIETKKQKSTKRQEPDRKIVKKSSLEIENSTKTSTKEKKFKIDRSKPKKEFYQCECGLILHWKVAEGHVDGCPRCGNPIPLFKIFSKME
ncbi:MAG: hypothetical protein ACXQS8_08275 [Candidatus Helarchaeales archaeon]